MREIILASQSPQRRLILDTLKVTYKVLPSNFAENTIKEKDLRQRAKKIALEKARAVLRNHPAAIIIAADTYAIFEDNALEKPKDKKEAREMLTKLSGKWLSAITGYAFINQETKLQRNTVIETLAKFRPLSKREISLYCETQPVSTWSAAFCPGYPEGASLIEKTQGSLTSFLYGLPMELVTRDLLDSGIAI